MIISLMRLNLDLSMIIQIAKCVAWSTQVTIGLSVKLSSKQSRQSNTLLASCLTMCTFGIPAHA